MPSGGGYWQSEPSAVHRRPASKTSSRGVMGRYVARRLLLTIPVLIGASFLIFAMVYALPGDPIRALAGDRPISPAVAAELRQQFNLNDPLLVQYGKYIGGLFQGDFGTDFAGRPVWDLIERRMPVTATLA